MTNLTILIAILLLVGCNEDDLKINPINNDLDVLVTNCNGDETYSSDRLNSQCKIEGSDLGVLGTFNLGGEDITFVQWVEKPNETEEYIGFTIECSSDIICYKVKAGQDVFYHTGKSFLLPSQHAISHIDFCVDCNILPIELEEFYVYAETDRFFVEWKTATEQDNEYFAIQTSSDGLNWKDIGKVDGQGDSSSTTCYEATGDISLAERYWRLTWVDSDGNVEYSHIEEIW